MKLKCPQCSQINPGTSKFCNKCGISFSFEEPKSSNNSTYKSGVIALCIVLFLFVLYGFGVIVNNSNEKLEETTQQTELHPVLGRKPFQSSWNGEVLEVRKYLQSNLNDFDSSEYVEWSPITAVKRNSEDFWGVRLKLRAKNAFGAYIVKDIYFYLRDGKVVYADGM